MDPINPLLQIQYYEARMRDAAAAYAQYASAAACAALTAAQMATMPTTMQMSMNMQMNMPINIPNANACADAHAFTDGDHAWYAIWSPRSYEFLSKRE